MFPQFDVGVRGVSWAQCLGVINNITKDLNKKAEKNITSANRGVSASFLLALISLAKCFLLHSIVEGAKNTD